MIYCVPFQFVSLVFFSRSFHFCNNHIDNSYLFRLILAISTYTAAVTAYGTFDLQLNYVMRFDSHHLQNIFILSLNLFFLFFVIFSFPFIYFQLATIHNKRLVGFVSKLTTLKVQGMYKYSSIAFYSSRICFLTSYSQLLTII